MLSHVLLLPLVSAADQCVSYARSDLVSKDTKAASCTKWCEGDKSVKTICPWCKCRACPKCAGWAPPSETRPCEKTKASQRFVADVQQRFFSTRSSLQRANRSWLELPFAEYVADPTAAAERMLRFIGLPRPPRKWRSTCALPWCAAYRWPKAER